MRIAAILVLTIFAIAAVHNGTTRTQAGQQIHAQISEPALPTA